MSKIVIPISLTAIILIAGIFAFQPIEQAATVHTQIQGSQLVLDRVNFALVPASGNLDDTNQIEIECGAALATDQDRPFIVLNLTIESILDAGGDDFDIGDIDVDAVALTDDGTLALTDMEVSAGVGTNAYGFVPVEVQFLVLAADGELDLVITEGGGDLTGDDVGANALILKRSDTVCAMTTGADD